MERGEGPGASIGSPGLPMEVIGGADYGVTDTILARDEAGNFAEASG